MKLMSLEGNEFAYDIVLSFFVHATEDRVCTFPSQLSAEPALHSRSLNIQMDRKIGCNLNV